MEHYFHLLHFSLINFKIVILLKNISNFGSGKKTKQKHFLKQFVCNNSSYIFIFLLHQLCNFTISIKFNFFTKCFHFGFLIATQMS